MLQTNFLKDSRETLSSCPTAGLSPRNSEIRRFCPPGPHTSLCIPIRASPGLRCKMDHLLPWPCPLDSEASLCNEEWLKLEGGRIRWEETQFLLELSLILCVWQESPPLSWPQLPHLSAVASQTCSSALSHPRNRQVYSPASSLGVFLSRIILPLLTPHVLSVTLAESTLGSHTVWALPSLRWSSPGPPHRWPCPSSL